jgi:hypothetical protein
MKYTLYILTTIFVSFSNAQNLKIQWQDESGRVFNINAPTGELGYTLLAGDKIEYNHFSGLVSQVGNTHIFYNYFNDKVTEVGEIHIYYDYSGRLSQVGGLKIEYNYSGKITGTSGTVN